MSAFAAWRDRPMIAFDLETTGVDIETARIVTACVAIIRPGVAPWITRWLLDPGVEIPEGATAVHGITTERAQAEGIPADKGVADIVGTIRAYRISNPGAPVVAFNAAYDLSLLDREARRHGLDPLDPGHVIDPFVIDRTVDRYRRGKRTLTATCAHYGVTLDGAHDATADALAAARLAWRLASHPDIAGLTLAELHDAQIGWHRKRQEDFAAYLTRTGKDASDVDGSWPVRPVRTEVAA